MVIFCFTITNQVFYMKKNTKNIYIYTLKGNQRNCIINVASKSSFVQSEKLIPTVYHYYICEFLLAVGNVNNFA
jgi:hypothetical protein